MDTVCLQRRDSKDIVNQTEQNITVVHNDPCDLFLLFWGCQHREHIGETYDGVEWRTNLMCHIRHEYAFPPAGIVGPFCLLFQLFLFLDENSDVADDAVATYELIVSIIIRYAIDDVPLRLIAFVEERTCIAEEVPWFIEGGLRMFEQQLAGVGCCDKTTLEVLKCDLSLWSAESSIEGHFIVDKRTAPEAHVAVVHQILQLSLILLDLLVGVTYLLVVLLVLQI